MKKFGFLSLLVALFVFGTAAAAAVGPTILKIWSNQDSDSQAQSLSGRYWAYLGGIKASCLETEISIACVVVEKTSHPDGWEWVWHKPYAYGPNDILFEEDNEGNVFFVVVSRGVADQFLINPSLLDGSIGDEENINTNPPETASTPQPTTVKPYHHQFQFQFGR